jgi:peptidyl-prolyl cis-trans isomerase D
MLDLMRRKKRLKIILWLVIFSLGLGMLLFFVPGMNMGSVVTDTSAATVDGEAILLQDFSEAYRTQVNRYTNRAKERIDPETLRNMGLPKQVLDGLISQKVVEITAKRLGIDVTPDEVRRAVETYPVFQENGKFFGIERYKAILAENSITITAFEEERRYAETLKKLQSIITDSLNVSDRELRDEFARENQQTVADYVILKKDDFSKSIKPAEAELRIYFDGHKDAYRIKEKRRAQYLLVPVAPIIPTIQVTDQEIRAEWDTMPHEETVEAAHILFRIADPSKEAEAKAKAESVLKQAKEGQDFAALAKKFSEDTGSAQNGGQLGPFQRGQGLVKEFEDAAFSMKAGEISGLVRSEYGFHIIKVSRHETPTLESSRVTLTGTVQLRKAQEIAKRKAEQAAAAAAKQKDLGLAVKDLGAAAELKETSPFKKDDNPFELGISEALKNAVFELKEIGSIGKTVEHPLGYAVPKLLEVQMPKAGDFALSRDQVEKDFIAFKSNELMQADAKKLSEEAAKQGSLEKAAKSMGIAVKVSQPFNFSTTPSPEIGSNPTFNQAAFDLAPGGVSSPISLLDNMTVLQVKSRTPFDESGFQKKRGELKEKLLQSIRQPFFEDYIRKATEDLDKAGKIRINPKAVELVSTSY